MKKYILLIALYCFVFAAANADGYARDSAQDIKSEKTIFINGVKLTSGSSAYLNGEKVVLNFDFDDAKLNMDGLLTLIENSKAGLNNLEGNHEQQKKDKRKNQDNKAPTRIEKRSFSNISEVGFLHSYGNIVVQETNSKQVELEIQYFDTEKEKASCSISAANKILSISTDKRRVNNSKAKIDYIINMPKGTGMKVDLKYGNIKMGDFSGAFSSGLAYSNLSAQSFSTPKIRIKIKYGNVKIEQVKNLDVSGDYNNIKIGKADEINLSGSYNNYTLDNVRLLAIEGTSSYGHMKTGTVEEINGSVKYMNVSVDNLISEMNLTTAYGDIKVKKVSSKLKIFKVRASYADISIGIPQDLSVKFDADLSYGDLKISEKHSVRYIESVKKYDKTVKKGQIGTKTPAASIIVSNKYANVSIK